MPIILRHQCQLNLTTDTGLPFGSSLLFGLLFNPLASPLGGAESLAPSGDKDVAEPKGLAGAPGQLPPFSF